MEFAVQHGRSGQQPSSSISLSLQSNVSERTGKQIFPKFRTVLTKCLVGSILRECLWRFGVRPRSPESHPALQKREPCWLNRALIFQEMMISLCIYRTPARQHALPCRWRHGGRENLDNLPSLQGKWTQPEFRIHSLQFLLNSGGY